MESEHKIGEVDEGEGRAMAVKLVRVEGGRIGGEQRDLVAREEPLEVRVEGRSVAVTMRTPGDDEALVAGFLFTEGVIRGREDIFEISACPSAIGEGDEVGRGQGGVIDVLLRSGAEVDWDRLTRHVFTSSSCGVCGKATLDSVFGEHEPVGQGWEVRVGVFEGLPGRLRAAQATFEQTGGLHASALFGGEGELLIVHEDVGRHNALDKVIGSRLLAGAFPLEETILLVSGRVSFELMQKALAARVPVVAAISAPSSLAVELAKRSGQTLVGFLRGGRMNIYAGASRLLTG
jgi:FdhD protein